MKNLKSQHIDQLTEEFENNKSLFALATSAGSINEMKEIADDFFIYSQGQLSELEQAFFNGHFDSLNQFKE